jgi:hypothetical protein
MREKLATIQLIADLKPISGADKIEVATILGWECVVKKGEFKIGDRCVYIEIDSIVPSDNPYFEFMKDRKYRVKTIKLRGQVSQGLVCPMSILPKHFQIGYTVGTDVTKELNIKHYEAIANELEVASEKQSKSKIVRWLNRYAIYRKYFSKKLKGGFPSFLNKTDEERIQNHPNWLHYDKPVYITEKLDGTSATYFIKKKNRFVNVFGVCSRSIYKKTKDNSYYWQIAIKEDIEKKLKEIQKILKCDICIQGEIIGPKIQKNKYNRKELEFYVFNIFNITKQKYASGDDVRFLSNFGFKMVPILSEIDGISLQIIGEKLPHTIDEIVKKSKGPSALNPDIPREGIVVRDYYDQKKLSFKCINPDFLLKFGE